MIIKDVNKQIGIRNQAKKANSFDKINEVLAPPVKNYLTRLLVKRNKARMIKTSQQRREVM